MVSSTAATVDAYLAGLPQERREVVSALRDLVNAHLPDGYREAMAYGMIGWAVPLSRFPDTYNGQPLCYAALAAQKNAYSLYLMGVYADAAQLQRLQAAAAAAGKRLDMGKSCLRFKRLDQLPLDAIAAAVAAHRVEDFIALHEAAHAGRRSGGAATKQAKAAAKNTAAKNAAAKKTAAGKLVAKNTVARPTAAKATAAKRPATTQRAAAKASVTKTSNARVSKSVAGAKAAGKRAAKKTSAK